MQNCTDSPPSAAGGGATEEPVMLFGVRIGVVDSMRKSNSMNNLSDYEPVNNTTAAAVNLDIAAANELIKEGGGYASADDAVPASNVSRERKRGVPWTEEEHKQFLVGLKKVGKGDWRGISRNYVKTRTPTQVASHAQKHFLRQSNLTRRRRRSSLFDITTDSVAAMPIDEDRNNQENQAQQVPLPTTQSPPVTPNANGFSVVPFPVTFSPVMLSMQGGNIIESPARTYAGPIPVPVPVPVTVLPVPMDLNFNQQVLSLNLSLASGNGQSRTRDSSFQVMQGFNNGDSIITGAA